MCDDDDEDGGSDDDDRARDNCACRTKV